MTAVRKPAYEAVSTVLHTLLGAGAMTAPLIWREATPYPILASPDSCALCGTDQRRHCQHFFGRHLGDDMPKGHVAPDDETRLARMRARLEEATS